MPGTAVKLVSGTRVFRWVLAVQFWGPTGTHSPHSQGRDPLTKLEAHTFHRVEVWTMQQRPAGPWGSGGGQGGAQAQNGQRAEKPPKEKQGGVWRVTRWSVCTTLAGWPLLAGLRPGSLKYVCRVTQFLSEKQGVY